MKLPLKKYFFVILGFFILILLQESFFSRLAILGIPINFFLIFIFFLSFFEKEKSALIFAVLGGIVLDVFSFSAFGINILTLFLAVFLVKEVSKLLKKTNVFVFLALFALFLLSFKLFSILSKLFFNLLL